MIFKLEFGDRTEFAQAKNMLHLLQSYERDYEGFQDIENVEEITDEEAKKIMLFNNEFNEDEPESDENVKEFSLFDACHGTDFDLIGSSEWI